MNQGDRREPGKRGAPAGAPVVFRAELIKTFSFRPFGLVAVDFGQIGRPLPRRWEKSLRRRMRLGLSISRILERNAVKSRAKRRVGLRYAPVFKLNWKSGLLE
jgi:hypothetical protein